MARITKEQREYIETEFRTAVIQRANDSIPKALLKKKAIAHHTSTTEVTIYLSNGRGRYGSAPVTHNNDRSKQTTTMPNPLLEEMNAAVAKAQKIVAKGDELWKQIEAEMILGSEDIKQTLADALAKVAKL